MVDSKYLTLGIRRKNKLTIVSIALFVVMHAGALSLNTACMKEHSCKSNH